MRFMYLYALVPSGWNRAIRTFLADFRQTSGGVVLVLWQGQYPMCNSGFSEYDIPPWYHLLSAIRKSVGFRGKEGLYAAKTPGGKNLWAVAFRLILKEKT